MLAAFLLLVFILVLLGVLGCLGALSAEIRARRALEDELRRRRSEGTSVIGIARVRVSPTPVPDQVRVTRVRTIHVRRVG
jgi:hypothetical protein